MADGTISVGAAVYDTVTLQVGMYILPPLSTVFLAEALAVLKAIQYARNIRMAAPVILTDSKSVLQAVASHTPTATTPREVVEIRRALVSLMREGARPALYWVPAHKGVPPNEAADAAADLAHTEGEETHVTLPPTCFYAAQHQHGLRAWQHAWTTDTKGRHLFGLTPQVGTRPWFSRVEGDRRTLCTLIRLRIGHTAARAHLHRCAGVESPVCQCGAPAATATHLYEDCLFVDRMGLEEALEEAGLDRSLQAILQQPAKAIPAMAALLAANPTLRF